MRAQIRPLRKTQIPAPGVGRMEAHAVRREMAVQRIDELLRLLHLQCGRTFGEGKAVTVQYQRNRVGTEPVAVRLQAVAQRGKWRRRNVLLQRGIKSAT